MRWKELLIGAAIALVVTVIGGLMVYLFTQEKDELKTEILSYHLDKQALFEGNDNLISIGALKFANIGNEPARTVVAEFKTDGAEIIEFNTVNEGGTEISKSISDNKQSVTLRIKSLLPNEIISATYLLNSPSKIEFIMRSERTIGKEGAIYSVKTERSSLLNDFLGDFVPLLILLAFAPIVFLLKYLRSNISRGGSKNNNAFVLLHNGANTESLSILESAVTNGEDGSLAMANYASALAISGDIEKAKIYIDASEFLARTKHEKAICQLNKSIVSHQANDAEECLYSLKKSLELSKSEIKSYLENSKVMRGIISSDERLSTLIENA
jgi:tetratricopeptide (TPR) repeat protein